MQKADPVRRNASSGTANGVVRHKQSSPAHLKGHRIAATTEAPQYIVESDNGGAAAHKRSALTKE